MKKLLITGASGFLGWHCCHLLRQGWQAIGMFQQNKKGVHPNADSCQADLTDKDAVWKILKAVKPEAVFHLAAHSGTGYTEQHPDETRPLNVDAVKHLAEMCAEIRSRLIFTSSEQLFSGDKGSYSETDAPNPKNEYGKQKWEAEKALQSIYPEATILRIAVLFGKAAPTANSFLNQWLEAWGNMLPVTAFHDEVRQFLSATSCADALFHLLHQGSEGIFHVGGETALSRYDFGKLAIEVLDLQNAKIESLSQQEIEMPAFRPQDLSLDLNKIKSTGFVPIHPLEELNNWKPYVQNKPEAFLN